MTLGTTLDLLYLVSAVAILWVAAMLAWMLCEAALLLRKANRTAKTIHAKVEWLEKTIEGIGERLEHSSAAISAVTTGGKAIASFIRARQKAMEDDEDEGWGKKKKKKR
jgi:hypothetical protein